MNTKIKITVIIAVISAIVVMSFAIILLVFSLFTNSEPYKHSIEVIENNAEVKEYLGSGYKQKGMISSSINLTGGGFGTANLSYKLKGKNGVSRVYVEAVKENGVWLYKKLVFYKKLGHSDAVDLLEGK